MIKVLVPARSEGKERGESFNEWIAARPSVDGEYLIWSPNGCINFDCGVHLKRRKDDDGGIINENQVQICAYGGTQVLVDGIIITGVQTEEPLDIGENVRVSWLVGRTMLTLYGSETSCKLEVMRYGKVVTEARLQKVEDAEADKIILGEKATRVAFLAKYRDGTSDFG